MNSTMSLEEFHEKFKKKKGPLTQKYNAKKTVIDGIIFASKLEAQGYARIKLGVEYGSISYFLRQIPFHLPGNVSYRCDFLVFMANGEVRYIDFKGFSTKEFILKRKMVEALYPVKIEVIKSLSHFGNEPNLQKQIQDSSNILQTAKLLEANLHK